MSGRVLIVDDIAQNVKLLEAKLSAEYFDVISATNGEDALKIAEEQLPDIILLDVMMPGMNGFEVCERLKENKATRQIPVVMVTALSETEDRVKGLQAGADEFLSKPVRDIPLMARVRSLVRLKSLLDTLQIREGNTGDIDSFQREEDEPLAANIAFVSDDRIASRQFKRILEEDGHHLKVFDTIDELKQYMAEFHDSSMGVDLVISLLHINGQEILRDCVGLRNMEYSRHTPVLLVAEEEDEQLLAKALEIGVSDYIMRPVDGHELLARVRTQLKRLRYQQRLKRTYRRSIKMALTDDLTRLYNRRYFNMYMNDLLTKSLATNKSVSLLLIDIDKFKNVNDTYGHDVGDRVLQVTAERLRNSVRDCDLIARLGGEEFIVVMPDSRIGLGVDVAERLRHAMESQPIEIRQANGEPLSLQITISIGISCSRTVQNATRDVLLKVADDALYQAKNSGRNLAVVGT